MQFHKFVSLKANNREEKTMIIFLLILIIVSCLGLRRANGEERDYMSINMTNSIKGFFLCMVFFSHIQGYTSFSEPYLDSSYQMIRKITGQCIVTMFLFYSGYGIMESIKRKGHDYVKRIPLQRFLKVLLQFDCAIILFWIYRYITGVHYDVRKMLLTFVGWDGIGNSNWYIFCVLWVYIFTFIAFMVFRDNHKKAVIGLFILSLLYMAIVCKLGKEYWWYDTILCYTWGMIFSLYRSKIESWINENFKTWLFFVAVFSIGYMTTYHYKNTGPVVYQLWVFCFVAAIVTFTMRFVIDSAPLQWLGRNLFELYILQRLAMMVLKSYMLVGEVTSITKYAYVVVSFLVTLIISVVYRETVGRIINKVIAKL